MQRVQAYGATTLVALLLSGTASAEPDVKALEQSFQSKIQSLLKSYYLAAWACRPAPRRPGITGTDRRAGAVQGSAGDHPEAKISGGGDHGKKYGALGCFNWRRGPLAQTMDHAIAGAQSSVIPVLGLGMQPSPDAVVVNTVSAIGPKRPQPMICQPDVAFQTLFGSVAEGNAGKVFRARNKLLDWIRSDIKRVERSLPAMDREKLDMPGLYQCPTTRISRRCKSTSSVHLVTKHSLLQICFQRQAHR